MILLQAKPHWHGEDFELVLCPERLEDDKCSVSWKPVGVLESGYHFPLLELIAPATEAPGLLQLCNLQFGGLGTAHYLPPAPKAFEVATGNSSSVGPLPPRQFLGSQSVLNTTRSKRDQVYGDIISPLDFGDIGKERKREKKTFQALS